MGLCLPSQQLITALNSEHWGDIAQLGCARLCLHSEPDRQTADGGSCKVPVLLAFQLIKTQHRDLG